MHENSCVRLAKPTALEQFHAQPYFPLGRCLVVSHLGLLEQHNQPATAGSFVFFQMTRLQTLRKFAFNTQNGRCFYCGLPMWEKHEKKAFSQRYPLPSHLIELCQSTAEHLHARQDGGEDHLNNIVAACKYCNSMRHKGRTNNAPSPKQYKHQVQKINQQGWWHPAWSVLNKASTWGLILGRSALAPSGR